MPLLGIYKSSGKSKTNVTLPSTKKNNLLQEVPEGGYSDRDYGVAESEATAEPDSTAEPDPTAEPSNNTEGR